MRTDRWTLSSSRGLCVVRSDALTAMPGLRHGFSTRRECWRSDFDLGGGGRTTAKTATRRRKFLAAVGFHDRDMVSMRQVHGARVVEAAELAGAGDPAAADAVVSSRGLPAAPLPAVRVADCVPVLVADVRGRVVAAVHAGWRGVAAGVVIAAVEHLGSLGAEPLDLRIALGPAIGGCCYEVGADVLEAVARASGVASSALASDPREPRLDLRNAIRFQLAGAGVAPDAIYSAPWCTRCRPDLFFSYRGEGAAAGRMMACIGWAGAAP